MLQSSLAVNSIVNASSKDIIYPLNKILPTILKSHGSKYCNRIALTKHSGIYFDVYKYEISLYMNGYTLLSTSIKDDYKFANLVKQIHRDLGLLYDIITMITSEISPFITGIQMDINRKYKLNYIKIVSSDNTDAGVRFILGAKESFNTAYYVPLVAQLLKVIKTLYYNKFNKVRTDSYNNICISRYSDKLIQLFSYKVMYKHVIYYVLFDTGHTILDQSYNKVTLHKSEILSKLGLLFHSEHLYNNLVISQDEVD